MNNEKYVMLAQQLLPNDFEISELRVEYRKEAKLGDTVISYVKYTSKECDSGACGIRIKTVFGGWSF